MKEINILKVSIYGVLSALFLSVMSLFVKLASQHTTESVIVLFRFSIGYIYILLVTLIKFRTSTQVFFPKTKKIHLHILRTVFSVVTMFLLFRALHFIPIMNATLLFMTAPFFVAILGALFFHNRVGIKVLLGIIIGFVGVLFALNPNGDIFTNHYSLYALASGATGAVSLLLIRNISKYDSPHTTMFYYYPMTVLVGTIMSVYNWSTPNVDGLIFLAAVGVCTILYQECLLRASQYAPAKVTSTLLYLTIVFGGVIDWFFWKEVPGIEAIFGFVLIFIGGATVLFFSAK